MHGYVLAGGESRRMGEDKAFLMLDGQTLFERAAATLSAAAETVKVVGLRGEYSGDLTVIADTVIDSAHEPRGSIIALYTALMDCRDEFAAVLACDLPFVESEMFAGMLSVIGSDEYLDCVVPRQPDGRLQPLCAVYRAAACLPFVEAMIAEGNYRLTDLTARLDVRIYDHPGDARWPTNVNTPDDLRKASELLNT